MGQVNSVFGYARPLLHNRTFTLAIAFFPRRHPFSQLLAALPAPTPRPRCVTRALLTPVICPCCHHPCPMWFPPYHYCYPRPLANVESKSGHYRVLLKDVKEYYLPYIMNTSELASRLKLSSNHVLYFLFSRISTIRTFSTQEWVSSTGSTRHFCTPISVRPSGTKWLNSVTFS